MKKPYIRPIAAVKVLNVSVPFLSTSNDWADTKRHSTFGDDDDFDEE